MSTLIFGFVTATWGNLGDLSVTAMDERGTVVAEHISSSVNWAKHDIGPRKADRYHERYPDGWTFEWLDDPESDPRWQEALRLNLEAHKNEQ